METIAPIIQEFLKNHPIISYIVLIFVGIFFLITFIKAFIYFLNEIKFIKLENLKTIKEDYLKNISNNSNETTSETSSSQNQLTKRLQKLIDSLIINEAFQKIIGIHIFNDDRKKFFLDLIEKTPYNYRYIRTIFPYIKKKDNSHDLKKEDIEIHINWLDKLFYFLANLPLIIMFALLTISFVLLVFTGKFEFLLLLIMSLLIILVLGYTYNNIYLTLKFQKEFLDKPTKLLYIPHSMIIIGVILGIYFLWSHNSLIIKNTSNKNHTIKQEKNVKHR